MYKFALIVSYWLPHVDNILPDLSFKLLCSGPFAILFSNSHFYGTEELLPFYKIEKMNAQFVKVSDESCPNLAGTEGFIFVGFSSSEHQHLSGLDGGLDIFHVNHLNLH